MNYEEFKAAVLKAFEGYEVLFNRINKPNQPELETLNVKIPGSNVGIVLYIEELYKQGASVEDVVKAYEKGAQDAPVVEVGAFEWDQVKDKLFFMAINKALNEEFLENTPFITICDLAFIARIQYGTTEDGLTSVVVKKSMLDNWGITEFELFEAVRKSAPKLLPIQVKSLNEILDIPDEYDVPFQVVGVETGVWGAGVLAYPDFFKIMEKKMGGVFFLIPSSIHEWLITSVSPEDENDLTRMVKEVNAEEVAPHERLADHAYIWNSVTKSLEIV